MCDELVSPPYPGDFDTLSDLLERIIWLKRWVVHHQSEVNETANELGYDQQIVSVDFTLQETPTSSAFLRVPVTAIPLTFGWLRSIRCQWDDLVRRYEDNWDCRDARVGRVRLVGIAVHILQVCFMTADEVSRYSEEVKQKQGVDLSALFKSQNIHLHRPLSSDDKLTDEDLDKLFNPPPADE